MGWTALVKAQRYVFLHVYNMFRLMNSKSSVGYDVEKLISQLVQLYLASCIIGVNVHSEYTSYTVLLISGEHVQCQSKTHEIRLVVCRAVRSLLTVRNTKGSTHDTCCGLQASQTFPSHRAVTTTDINQRVTAVPRSFRFS